VELRIRNDDIGIAQARDIEGLAGGGCRDADVRCSFGYGCHRGEHMAGHDQIVVDFIRQNHDIIGGADVDHFRQFRFGPDAADRIMRVAEQHQFDVRIFGFFGQAIKIDFVTISIADQRIVDEPAFRVLD
jgi:hypothetical protein